MNRIFLSLAWFAIVFVAATLIIGLTLGDLGPESSPDTLRRATVHRLCGIASALAVVLVDSIVVTYFIGTSRWCKEVAEAYQLDGKFVQRSNALKRRTFPYAVVSMLTMVGVVALGGAADPGGARLPPLGMVTWPQLHLAGAMLGIAVIAYAFFVQWSNIDANRQVIDAVMQEVRRIRQEKGLDV